MADPALDTLMLPLETGEIELAADAKVLFLRARTGRALKALSDIDLVCAQSFAPDRDALKASGLTVVAETEDTNFDAVLVLPGRQRQEARAQLSEAVSRAREGGVVLACAPNTEGAKTLERDLSDLLGGAEKLTKNKCRVVWETVEAARIDGKLLEDWLELDAPRPVLNGDYVSRPGLFA